MRKLLLCFKLLLVVGIEFCCAFCLTALCHAPVFAEGESYVYYLQPNSSSLAVHTKTPFLTKLQLKEVAGESAVYSGNRYESLKETFQAELLFCEEAAGVKNFYLYSPKLAGGVLLNGEKVNLHVAVSQASTAVGTPLIFGGF